MRVAYVSADPDVPAFANRASSLPIREMCVAMLDTGFDVSLFVANRGGGDVRHAHMNRLPFRNG